MRAVVEETVGDIKIAIEIDRVDWKVRPEDEGRVYRRNIKI
jgi:DNA topoisomerase VI subunit A